MIEIRNKPQVAEGLSLDRRDGVARIWFDSDVNRSVVEVVLNTATVDELQVQRVTGPSFYGSTAADAPAPVVATQVERIGQQLIVVRDVAERATNLEVPP